MQRSHLRKLSRDTSPLQYVRFVQQLSINFQGPLVALGATVGVAADDATADDAAVVPRLSTIGIRFQGQW